MLNQIMLWQAMIVGWTRDHVSGKDDTGASLVEYALLLALIAVVAIGALTFLGGTVSNSLNNVGQQFNNVQP
jgi:pilus assembly protein Flp/PilA